MIVDAVNVRDTPISFKEVDSTQVELSLAFEMNHRYPSMRVPPISHLPP